MIKRIWNLFQARNKEFLRDRSALAWNILFPFLVIIGFSVLFNDEKQVLYKAGVVKTDAEISSTVNDRLENFRKTKYVEFIEFSSEKLAMDKLMHHRIDILINPSRGRFWTSRTSPKGYVAERLFNAAAQGQVQGEVSFQKEQVEGREIPYIEWLFPGILGMNMMFSALFGVGYVVVRYRKNGVLKRLSVTPLKPYEFLTAQILSRMFLILMTTAFVFVGCMIIYGFDMRGSYIILLLVFCLGGFSMISLALLVASRSSSEEFAGGILNIITWPMMFLSEVWFSLEGAEPWVQKFSMAFPLTHMVDAVRKIMNDGAGIAEIRAHLLVMAAMSLIFLGAASYLFKWHKE